MPWCLVLASELRSSDRFTRLDFGHGFDRSGVVVEGGREWCAGFRCRCRGRLPSWRGRRCRARGRCSLSLDSGAGVRTGDGKGGGEEGGFHFVYHVRDQAFHLVVVLPCRSGSVHLHVHTLPIHPRLTDFDGRGEVSDVDPCIPLPLVVQIPSQIYLPEQVPQTDIPPPFQSEVDAPFDELVIPFREGDVERRERADADGQGQRGKEGAEARVGRQETGRGELLAG